jgi:hypothetical protein
MPIPNRTYLIDRVSKFQKRDEKRVYEETIKDRLDPKIFSVYKQYIDPKRIGASTSTLEYVEAGYVEEGYIITYDSENPGNPL